MTKKGGVSNVKFNAPPFFCIGMSKKQGFES